MHKRERQAANHQGRLRDNNSHNDIHKIRKADITPSQVVNAISSKRGNLDDNEKRQCIGNKIEIRNIEVELEMNKEGKIEREDDDENITKQKENNTPEQRRVSQFSEVLVFYNLKLL